MGVVQYAKIHVLVPLLARGPNSKGGLGQRCSTNHEGFRLYAFVLLWNVRLGGWGGILASRILGPQLHVVTEFFDIMMI